MSKGLECLTKCCGELKKRQRKVRSDKGKKRGGKIKKSHTPYSKTSLAKQASAIAQKNKKKMNAKAKARTGAKKTRKPRSDKGKKRVVRGKGMKGSASKTHKGDKDYTTKRGDKDYHQAGKDVKKSTKPFTGKKKRKVRSDKGKKRGGKAKPQTSSRTSALMKKGKATAGRVRANKERLKNIVFRHRKGKNVKNVPPPSAYFGAEIRPFIAPPTAYQSKRGRRKPDILDGSFI